jgi:hypothetical protein
MTPTPTPIQHRRLPLTNKKFITTVTKWWPDRVTRILVGPVETEFHSVWDSRPEKIFFKFLKERERESFYYIKGKKLLTRFFLGPTTR